MSGLGQLMTTFYETLFKNDVLREHFENGIASKM